MNPLTEEEMKKKLTPEQYNVCFLKGTEPPFPVNIQITTKTVCTHVLRVGMNYFLATQNTIPRQDGQLFGMKQMMVLSP